MIPRTQNRSCLPEATGERLRAPAGPSETEDRLGGGKAGARSGAVCRKCWERKEQRHAPAGAVVLMRVGDWRGREENPLPVSSPASLAYRAGGVAAGLLAGLRGSPTSGREASVPGKKVRRYLAMAQASSRVIVPRKGGMTAPRPSRIAR